jgi:hypothetical protein
MASVGSELSLYDKLQMQNALVKEGEINRDGVGGYREIGRMIELRHEIAKDGNSPNVAAAKKTGVVLDWLHYHNGPRLGLSKDRTQLLIIGKVQMLPPIKDPNWKLTQMVKMDYGQVPAAALSPEQLKEAGITLEDPPMVKQSFGEHARGTFGDYMVIGPLTQALYKIEGIKGMTLIRFASDVYTGESPMFYVQPGTGEGHFCGGQFFLE